MKNLQTEILIVGAGPSGLTAGFKLIDKKEFIIIEKSPNYVGGISRTEKYKNFKFDIGGHRFFSKSKEINKLWDQILPHDIILRKRSSRILFKNKEHYGQFRNRSIYTININFCYFLFFLN